MDSRDLKGNLMNSYLNQQLMESSVIQQNTVQALDLPDNAILEEFKNQVRIWVENDNMIKKLQAVLKERNAVKKTLSEKILRFMAKYNIEDLNTKDGSKLRYKVKTAKLAPSKAEIKDRLKENFGKVDNLDELTKLVFDANEKKEVPVLRRLKNNGLSV